jgi:hypothetical protein
VRRVERARGSGGCGGVCLPCGHRSGFAASISRLVVRRSDSGESIPWKPTYGGNLETKICTIGSKINAPDQSTTCPTDFAKERPPCPLRFYIQLLIQLLSLSLRCALRNFVWSCGGDTQQAIFLHTNSKYAKPLAGSCEQRPH